MYESVWNCYGDLKIYTHTQTHIHTNITHAHTTHTFTVCHFKPLDNLMFESISSVDSAACQTKTPDFKQCHSHFKVVIILSFVLSYTSNTLHININNINNNDTTTTATSDCLPLSLLM